MSQVTLRQRIDGLNRLESHQAELRVAEANLHVTAGANVTGILGEQDACRQEITALREELPDHIDELEQEYRAAFRRFADCLGAVVAANAELQRLEQVADEVRRVAPDLVRVPSLPLSWCEFDRSHHSRFTIWSNQIPEWLK